MGGLSADAEVVVNYKVTAEELVSIEPVSKDITVAYMNVFGLPVGSLIDVSWRANTGNGRRLVSSWVVTAVGTSDNPTAIDNAASNTNAEALTAALKAVDGYKYADVLTQQVKAPVAGADLVVKEQ